jgi:hypothetical protein
LESKMPQSIAQDWAGFDDARRQSLLSRMSPEQKAQLRKELEGGGATAAAPAAQPAKPSLIDKLTEIQKPNPNDRWNPKEAVKAVGNIGAGGLGMLLHPINTLEGIGGMFTAPLEMAEGKKFSETVPGQMVQSLKENPLGTIEAGIGQAGATEGLARVLPKVAKTAAAPATKVVRGLTDTGKGPIKTLVKTAAKANEDIATKTAKLDETAKTREQKAGELKQATESHRALEDQESAKAKGEENEAWSTWRGKMKGATIDVGEVSKAVADLKKISPEVSRELSRLEPLDDEVPPESPYAQMREKIAQGQGGKSFEQMSPTQQEGVKNVLKSMGMEPDPIEFNPESGQPVSVEQAHRVNSILGRMIRNKRFEGPIEGEMIQVNKAIRKAIDKSTADRGATDILRSAREQTIRRQEAFGRERTQPRTVRSEREKFANPEGARAQKEDSRIDAAGKVSPELAESARNVRNVRDALKEMPSEQQIRKERGNIPPRETIGEEEIQAAKQGAMYKRADWLRGRGLWMSVWPIEMAIKGVMRGDPGALMDTAAFSGSTLGILYAASHALENPTLVNFLSKATKADMEAVPPELRGSFPSLVKAAAKKGIKVSDAVAAAGGATAGANQRKRVGDLIPKAK